MPRHVLVAVDDSASADGALAFALDLLKPDDVLHLLHVARVGIHMTPELEMTATMGVIEDTPEQKKKTYDAAVALLKTRFVPKLPPALASRGVEVAPDGAPEALGSSSSAVRLEVIRAAPGNDAVGAAVVARADALGAGTVVVLAKHSRSAVAEFFVGSVCALVTKKCKHATDRKSVV